VKARPAAFRIGVDGGGTKTECILVDESGRIVARHLAPGCNPSIIGRDAAARVASKALKAIRAKADGTVELTLLCMAGSAAHWMEFAAKQKGLGRVVAMRDALPILELAAPDGPGLVLHAGTGSFVAARTDEVPAQVHYGGGLGWRFGDEGSGYDIGRRAIARALLELQGWEPVSRLSALVRGKTGCRDAAAMIRHFYDEQAPNAQIAALTPAILALAGEDEPVALGLVVDSVGGLLQLATQVAGKLFPYQAYDNLKAGLSGPILTHPAVMPELSSMSRLPLHAIEGAPIEGVRRLLLREPVLR